MRRVFVMLGHFQFNWLWALCTQVAFSSIQFTHESKYMHGCRYALNGTEATLDGSQCLDFMYGQTLGWSYVNTPGMQWCGKQRWHQASECRHVQERILIPCCICSWHARDLRISTQIEVPKPESHGSCSQLKVYFSDRSSERPKGQHHRRWENQCWLNNHSIFSSSMAAQPVV